MKQNDLSCKKRESRRKYEPAVSNPIYNDNIYDDRDKYGDRENKDSFMISTETIRTYKVGLRVPESLLEEQNKLVIGQEILQYLINIFLFKTFYQKCE